MILDDDYAFWIINSSTPSQPWKHLKSMNRSKDKAIIRYFHIHTSQLDPFTNRKPGRDVGEENKVLFSRIYRKFYVSHGTVHTKILVYEWRALCYSFFSRATAASTLVCWKQFDPHFDSCRLRATCSSQSSFIIRECECVLCVCRERGTFAPN